MQDSVDKVRRAIKGGIMKAHLAQVAGVHFNSLNRIDDPEWNPTRNTLEKLCDAVDVILGRITGEVEFPPESDAA